MAQEISAGFHYRPDKTLHFVTFAAQLSLGHRPSTKRHFELAFDIGKQAHALFFRYGVQWDRQRASIDAPGEQCLQGFWPSVCGNSYFRYPCLKNFFLKSSITN